MYKSAISDQFYAGDGSFATEANSTLEQFSTPLKKLPNSSINDFRNDLHLHYHDRFFEDEQPDSALSTTSQRSQLYKLMSESTSPQIIQPTAHGNTLRPLSDCSTKLNETFTSGNQNGLFSEINKNEWKANGAVFYKPMSMEGPILPNSMIPPPLKQTARNPFVVSDKPETFNINADFEDLDDDEDDAHNGPTGEWTSPVVFQALRRQINKERIFKNVWLNIMRFVSFHLTLLFAAYFYRLYEIKFYDENRIHRTDAWSRIERLPLFRQSSELLIKVGHYLHYLQWYFIFRIFVGIIQLLRPQDQCTDLPLTNKQRKLIGLKLLNFGEDSEEIRAELVIKERLFESSQQQPIKLPKYRQLNDLPGYMHHDPKPEHDEDAAIALSNLLPPNRLIHSGPGIRTLVRNEKV